MDLSTITIKQLFKAVPLSCGVAGVVSGGYGCNELGKSAYFSQVLEKAEYQEGSNNYDRTKILLKNDGCYKRYFSKDVQESELEMGKAVESTTDISYSEISDLKLGCAVIISYKNSEKYLAEIALMNDNEAELFYFVDNKENLNIIKRKFSKSDNKWTISKEAKNFWTKSSTKIEFTITLNNSEIALGKSITTENKTYDLISTNSDIKMDIPNIKLLGTWEERNKH